MSKIKQLLGYYYAVSNYLRTPKGRHDAIDYMQAAALMALVALILGFIIKFMDSR